MQKLAQDLAMAVAGKSLSLEQRSRITQDMQTVFSASGKLPASRIEAFVVDVPLLLKALGVSTDFTSAIGDDLRAARKEALEPVATTATP